MQSSKYRLSASEVSRVVEMAWEDRTPFEVIEATFGLSESETIKLMRREMKPRSFRLSALTWLPPRYFSLLSQNWFGQTCRKSGSILSNWFLYYFKCAADLFADLNWFFRDCISWWLTGGPCCLLWCYGCLSDATYSKKQAQQTI